MKLRDWLFFLIGIVIIAAAVMVLTSGSVSAQCPGGVCSTSSYGWSYSSRSFSRPGVVYTRPGVAVRPVTVPAPVIRPVTVVRQPLGGLNYRYVERWHWNFR